MFTDMVGYTAAAQADEKATLALRKEQEDLLRSVLAEYQGREVKSTGDGFLVEFDSALNATECAVTIQRRLQERNAKTGVPPISVRIGIHLGDVEQLGNDIFGDAVNIAARIEPVAEPGGICLSGAVYEQVRNKLVERLERHPPTRLKGLQATLDLYRVLLPWAIRPGPTQSTEPTGIAVLPFSNISPDPRDEYFADGLTEELISVLSQMGRLRVIARTSVTPYKSTSKGIPQIGGELGVSSILEGSVRKAGSQLRITVQLIDVGTQGHIWTNTYDRELNDVFAVQADIAKQVAEVLKVKLRVGVESRLLHRPSVRPDSYLAYLKGRTLLHGRSEAALTSAEAEFARAIALDPTNAAACAGLADTSILKGEYAGKPWSEALEAGRTFATRAVELDPGLSEGHASLGLVFECLCRYHDAEQQFIEALTLNPGSASARHWYAEVLMSLARPEEALREQTLAKELDPLSLVNQAAPAWLLMWLGRYDEALVQIEKAGELEDHGPFYHLLLSSLSDFRSEFDRAFDHLDRYRELKPGDPLIPAYYAELFALTGRRDTAIEQLEQVRALPDITFGKAGVIAFVHCLLGNLDECFLWLERSRKDHTLRLESWRCHPFARPVREDPRFQDLLQQIGLGKKRPKHNAECLTAQEW